MDIEKTMQVFSEMGRETRSGYHLTLGELIEALESADDTATVQFDDGEKHPCRPHSYRGYYEDLSFEPTEESVGVFELLAWCQESLGKTFVGWKGGDFVMDEKTPLWMAESGDCGRAIIAVTGENPLILVTKEMDE